VGNALGFYVFMIKLFSGKAFFKAEYKAVASFLDVTQAGFYNRALGGTVAFGYFGFFHMLLVNWRKDNWSHSTPRMPCLVQSLQPKSGCSVEERNSFPISQLHLHGI
jgi:hypothetical protein